MFSGYLYISDIIENHDILVTIIMMLNSHNHSGLLLNHLVTLVSVSKLDIKHVYITQKLQSSPGRRFVCFFNLTPFNSYL